MDGPDMLQNINNEGRVEKDLTGRDLPPDWPRITRDEDYRNRFEGLVPGVDSVIERFSLHLKQGDKELVYLAVEHLNDPESPQFPTIERYFNRMSPQKVLHEGYSQTAFIPDRDTAMRYGEIAYLHYLVQQHNAGLKEEEQPISIESTDMPAEEWIKAFKELGHSNEEIAIYDVLRMVYAVVEQVRRNQRLSSSDKTLLLGEITAQINGDLNSFVTNKEFILLFAQLPRQDGREWSAEVIKEEVKKLTGENFSADINQLKIPRFRQMFDEESQFRDKYVVLKIAKTVQQHDRVLAVMGSSHVLREEASLREFFGTENPALRAG